MTCQPSACPNWQERAHCQIWRAAGEKPGAAGVYGYLRALRRLHGQVPVLPGHRRPAELARGARRAAAQGLPALFHPGRASSRHWARPPTSTRRCWRSGTPTSTSAPNAAAARSSAPTASTRPRSPWPRARSWPPSACPPSTSPRWSPKCIDAATTWASRPRPGRITASSWKRNVEEETGHAHPLPGGR